MVYGSIIFVCVKSHSSLLIWWSKRRCTLSSSAIWPTSLHREHVCVLWRISHISAATPINAIDKQISSDHSDSLTFSHCAENHDVTNEQMLIFTSSISVAGWIFTTYQSSLQIYVPFDLLSYCSANMCVWHTIASHSLGDVLRQDHPLQSGNATTQSLLIRINSKIFTSTHLTLSRATG